MKKFDIDEASKFNLSSKLCIEVTNVILKKDVKEFIRLLKEKTSCKKRCNCLVLKQQEIHKIIDTLAGEELI